MKSKVLFVCAHNSARSQMAEAFLERIGGEEFDVYSAGITAGALNPYVVAAMKEIGFDIEGNATKTVFDPLIADQEYDYVFTVCQESAAQPCPIYPTAGTRISWHFLDPSEFEGDHEAIMANVRIVRDRIREQVEQWYTQAGGEMDRVR
ncbi:arsenate reductase ArsC [bacterium]|nr:MAG: arsenate reductase ArsC [bacterium]